MGRICSALGWVASPIISKILTKGFDYLGYDTAKKILVLERVMQVVETSPYRPRLEKLFKELKSAFYEAEEILDAVEYHCLERQTQDGKLQSSMDKFWSSVAKFFSLKNEVFMLLPFVLISLSPPVLLFHVHIAFPRNKERFCKKKNIVHEQMIQPTLSSSSHTRCSL